MRRVEYHNLNAPTTVTDGFTTYHESVVDMEDYLLPIEQARGAGLWTWGVVSGLSVQATPGQPAVTVLPGVGLDGLGRTVVLAVDGTAVVKQDVPPDAIIDVPTEIVPAAGLTLPLTAVNATLLVTVTWREVVEQSDGQTPKLLHAPWLRVLAPAAVPGDGSVLVLARVTTGAGGAVQELAAGPRRAVGVLAERLELRFPVTGTGKVTHEDGTHLTSRSDGGLAVTVPGPAGRLTAIEVAGGTGGVRFPAGGLTFSGGGRDWSLTAGTDGGLRVRDDTATADRLVLDAKGNVAIRTGSLLVGAAAADPANSRPLQVSGSEIHSGGPLAGFSFSSRGPNVPFVETPAAGERWVWFGENGSARLWSGSDQFLVNVSQPQNPQPGVGLDVMRRMRIRDTNDTNSPGLFLWTKDDGADRGFVGLTEDKQNVAFWGRNSGFSLRMHVDSGAVSMDRSLSVAGQLSASGGLGVSGGFGVSGPTTLSGPVTFARDLVNTGPSTLQLFGSRISDTGGGILRINSGGGVIRFNGDFGRDDGPTRIRLWGSEIGDVGGGTFYLKPVQSVTIQGAMNVTGRLDVAGGITKHGGWFQIDHPLDPENSVLRHSFVESPDMLNIYTGRVTVDDTGEAEVTLPDWFEALNGDICYQLTPVGRTSPATVLRELKENRFVVAADPGSTVCWQLTGIRHDRWAQENRLPVEELKSAVAGAEHEKGTQR